MRITADTDCFGFSTAKVLELERVADRWVREEEEERIAEPESWLPLSHAIPKYCPMWEKQGLSQFKRGSTYIGPHADTATSRMLSSCIEWLVGRAAFGEYALRGRPQNLNAHHVEINPQNVRTSSILCPSQCIGYEFLPVEIPRDYDFLVRGHFDVQVAERNKFPLVKPSGGAGRPSLREPVLEVGERMANRGEYFNTNREWGVVLYAYALVSPRFAAVDVSGMTSPSRIANWLSEARHADC